MGDPTINYLHMAGVAPLLGYVGHSVYNEQPLDVNFGIFLLILALLVFVYHASLAYRKTQAAPAESSADAAPVDAPSDE